MSRHEVPAPDGLQVVVGWDPQLATFFAQVWDRRLDADDPASELLWTGAEHGQIRTPVQVRELVAPWVVLSDEVLTALADDAREPAVVAVFSIQPRPQTPGIPVLGGGFVQPGTTRPDDEGH